MQYTASVNIAKLCRKFRHVRNTFLRECSPQANVNFWTSANSQTENSNIYNCFGFYNSMKNTYQKRIIFNNICKTNEDTKPRQLIRRQLQSTTRLSKQTKYLKNFPVLPKQSQLICLELF